MDKRHQVPAGFVSRRTLREQANVSEHELKTLGGQGLLKSTCRNNGGWHLYPTSEVDRVRKLCEEMRDRDRHRAAGEEPTRLLPAYKESSEPYSLEQYRAVYTQFETGTPLDKIPMVVDIHPSILNVILKDAKHLAGAFVVAKPTVDAINKLPFRDLGTIRNGDELLQALEALSEMSESDEPPRCQASESCESQAKICLPCAVARFAPKKPQKPDVGTTAAAPIPKAAARERRRREASPTTNGSAPT